MAEPLQRKSDERWRKVAISSGEGSKGQGIGTKHTHTTTFFRSHLVSQRSSRNLDIAAQIQEAKLNPAVTEVAEGEDARTELPTFDIPPVRRRKISPIIWEVTEAPLSPPSSAFFQTSGLAP